jgi:hypothetical protein
MEEQARDAPAAGEERFWILDFFYRRSQRERRGWRAGPSLQDLGFFSFYPKRMGRGLNRRGAEVAKEGKAGTVGF